VEGIQLSGDFLGADGARAGFILFGGFVLSFGFIRFSTRMIRKQVSWWPGNIETGGLHVHHMVFGIVLLLLCGFLNFALDPQAPWVEALALGFGIGAGLTLDEFALWLHLEDVYWAEEGRRSVDAVVIAAIIGGLVLLGFVPFATDSGVPAIVLSVLTALALATVAVLKGKLFLGVATMLMPLIGLFAAIRLAKPGSLWARRRYREGSRKLERARSRFERHQRRYRAFQDRIAGAPE
jgi:hypothetical protein